jgi:hypothetical protein
MAIIKSFLGSQFEVVAETAEGHIELTDDEMALLCGGEGGGGEVTPPPPPPEEDW